jgi:hypothetical protein
MSRMIGFYSYKGGVGRSMALAHCATELAFQGRKVLIVDWDLEAPGQHCTDLFTEQFADGRGPAKGFIEFSRDFAARGDQGLPALDAYIWSSEFNLADTDRGKASSSAVESGNGNSLGSIFLLPAGGLADLANYRKMQSDFDWSKLFDQSTGMAILRWFRSEAQRLGFDDVLLDSRTGNSDPFYIIALELADILVVVSGYNRQNLQGAASVVEELATFPVALRPERLVLVGSPKPSDDGAEDDWRLTVKNRISFWRNREFDIELPYVSRLAYKEALLNITLHSSANIYSASIKRLIEIFEKTVEQSIISTDATNPFVIPRSDYASNQDLLRIWVGPGEALHRAVNDFMPLMVFGNRGTGKTMLAKHFDHETEFDRKLGDVVADDLPSKIGLYLRFDLDLLNSFNTRDDSKRKIYNQLFANFFDLLVIRRALGALDRFGGITSWCDESNLFSVLLREFEEDTPDPDWMSYSGFISYTDRHFSKIRRYLNNPTIANESRVVLLQGNILMKLLVEVLLKEPVPRFGSRWFAVMVDEVEHFGVYQQEVLNSRIKQIKRNDRVTYRYFLRHEGLRTKNTVVEGQLIQERNDFRTYNLDEGMDDDTFEDHLKQVAQRQLDLDEYFKSLGVTRLDQLFEAISPEDEARRLIDKSKRTDPLKSYIEKHHKTNITQFLYWYDKEPAILRRAVAVIMLNQGKSPSSICESYALWDKTAQTQYHNYHRAALHWLCTLYKKDKLYGGLNQLVQLSGNNVRYFLQCCNAVVEKWLATGSSRSLPIPIDVQDSAVRELAQTYLDDLRGKPAFAEEMLNLVQRIGRVFEAAHRSPRQSQYEVNHFSIEDYAPDEDVELTKFLRECRMENVLLRRPGNKQKTLSDDRLDDWLLHPAFAPLFNISVRHKKKIDKLSASDLKVLFNGSPEAFKALLRRYTIKFGDEADDLQSILEMD